MSVLDQLDPLRSKFIPAWAELRTLGNSKAVQASAIFPVVGYLILLSGQVTNFFDGGLTSDPVQQKDWLTQLWQAKLYFVYFGLLLLGLGSALYQWRCPRLIKKHGDWEDYVRIDGPVMDTDALRAVRKSIQEAIGKEFFYTPEDQRSETMRAYYSLLATAEVFTRFAVACLFYAGLALLAVPSIVTALRIIARL
jgi:hypothetical protein